METHPYPPLPISSDVYSPLPLDSSAPLLSYNAPKSPRFNLDDESTPLSDKRMSGQELRASALEKARRRGSVISNAPAVPKSYTPIPFTTWFSVLLLTYMVLLALTCELLVHFSQRDHGFDVAAVQRRFGTSEHYLWSTLVVAFAASVSVAWGYLAWWVKASQPLVDLAAGNTTADRSLLLNYTSQSDWLILWKSLRRHHYLTFLSASICILTFAISPLASALFEVRQVTLPAVAVNSVVLGNIGLSSYVGSGQASLAAAGYVISTFQSGTMWPPFLDSDNGALVPWEVLPEWGTNGSVFANTASIKSAENCFSATTTTTLSESGVWTIGLSGGTCQDGSVQIVADQASGWPQFFVFPIDCTGGQSESEAEFQPVAFIALNGTSIASTASLCFPTIEVLPVYAGIDLATQNIIQTQVTGAALITTPLAQSPLLGRALNVIAANASAPTSSTLTSRISATATVLTTSLEKALENSSIDATSFTSAVAHVYSCFLASFAAPAYLQPASQDTSAVLFATVSRLVVTPAVAHVLTAIFLVLAVTGAYLMRAHSSLRRRAGVSLPSDPGTIASAVAVAGQCSGLVSAKDDRRLMEEVLSSHRYGLDKNLGNIVVIGPVQD